MFFWCENFNLHKTYTHWYLPSTGTTVSSPSSSTSIHGYRVDPLMRIMLYSGYYHYPPSAGLNMRIYSYFLNSVVQTIRIHSYLHFSEDPCSKQSFPKAQLYTCLLKTNRFFNKHLARAGRRAVISSIVN